MIYNNIYRRCFYRRRDTAAIRHTTLLNARGVVVELREKIRFGRIFLVHYHNMLLQILFKRTSPRAIRTFVHWRFAALVVQVPAEAAFDLVHSVTIVVRTLIHHRTVPFI